MKLNDIKIEGTITSIGSDSFSKCTNLKTIKLPESLLTIEDHAFTKSGLNTFTFPTQVTILRDGLFRYCRQLNSVTLLGEVTSIEQYCFQFCISLYEIDLPESITDIRTDGLSLSGFKALTIPEKVLLVYEFRNLVSFVILGNVTTIMLFLDIV